MENAAHPQRHRIEMRAHADGLASQIVRLLNTAGAVNEHIAVTKFSMRENRDCPERRAAADPTEKHAHLQLAHVELQTAREAAMALLGRQREDFQVDPLRLEIG